MDQQDASGRDEPRLAATGRDNDYTLSLEEVAERYAKAGHARTLRTLQRYCASGHLDAQKLATVTGDKYLVTPQSVARHIAQIQELNALHTVATDRREARHLPTLYLDRVPQELEVVLRPLLCLFLVLNHRRRISLSCRFRSCLVAPPPDPFFAHFFVETCRDLLRLVAVCRDSV